MYLNITWKTVQFPSLWKNMHFTAISTTTKQKRKGNPNAFLAHSKPYGHHKRVFSMTTPEPTPESVSSMKTPVPELLSVLELHTGDITPQNPAEYRI